MTEAEAMALKRDDIVLTKIGPQLVRATVLRVDQYDVSRYRDRPYYCRCYTKGRCSVCIALRRLGHFKRRDGKTLPFPPLTRCPGSLKFVRDATTANVYADWLEDHNFPEAATALRGAFPMDDGRGKT